MHANTEEGSRSNAGVNNTTSFFSGFLVNGFMDLMSSPVINIVLGLSILTVFPRINPALLEYPTLTRAVGVSQIGAGFFQMYTNSWAREHALELNEISGSFEDSLANLNEMMEEVEMLERSASPGIV